MTYNPTITYQIVYMYVIDLTLLISSFLLGDIFELGFLLDTMLFLISDHVS